MLVTDVVARQVRKRLACQGFCQDKEDEVIATKRPKSDGKCIAFICRDCRLNKQLISDCWGIYEDLLMKSKEKANCTYMGKEIRDGQVVDSNGRWSICLDGTVIATDSLLSHFAGI